MQEHILVSVFSPGRVGDGIIGTTGIIVAGVIGTHVVVAIIMVLVFATECGTQDTATFLGTGIPGIGLNGAIKLFTCFHRYRVF